MVLEGSWGDGVFRSIHMFGRAVLVALVLVTAMPSQAQVATIAVDPIEAYYASRLTPLWFAEGAPTPAANSLPGILRRAPLDGLADGRALASQVERAIQAAGQDPNGALQMDRVLSRAWVRYVQTLEGPLQGFEYADDRLQPKVSTPIQILWRVAANQPQLLDHVLRVAAVNPIYSALRDSVWNESLASASPPSAVALNNLARARIIAPQGKSIIIDVRSAKLYMLDHGQLVDSMRVVVGKPQTPTPLIASTIYYATLNPYWNVPQELVQSLVAARVVAQGPSYLRAHNYRIVTKYGPEGTDVPATAVDWKAAAKGAENPLVRQLPGPLNSMGKMKFAFANSGGIYLHDTPNKVPFKQDNRLISNGCIRLEDAQRLGRWLLGREPRTDSTEPDAHVLLPSGVPVYVTYLTISVDQGRPKTLADAYGLDVIEGERAVAAR
jgi:murein L,D-transpeptidase YcbB/YkuD